ncbi:AMP-binding protein [Maritalea porphyrae]|uniref:AMP-binding protein n=1 Tax=Maritalea porphyrae TaxID=880732 RepID=UPI0022B07075|nr:AMP-binding protein [Maritalea porphyrae]MCZ4271423.1 AMP-binding protein [Maritalea porphyrae]
MLKNRGDVRSTRDGFKWEIPEHYNIGVDICDRLAAQNPDNLAIIDIAQDKSVQNHTFGQLRDFSNQLAHVLDRNVQLGDRIAVSLPQSFETAAAHIAITKIGAVSLPLFTLFGPEALLHRMSDSGAKVIITNAAGVAMIAQIRQELPALEQVFCVDGPIEDAIDLHAVCAEQSTHFTPINTKAEDPAILIYTSGTTGNPKGALHAHRVLLGHLPGVEMSHNFLPQPDDLIWTPADWAWIGGLLDVLMPALHHGIPVIARRFEKFRASAAFELMQEFNVRNAFLPPTALKMMRQDPNAESWNLKLRSVASGGETLGKELIEWGEKVFGTTINEFYGQTECNMIVSSCAALAPAEPGVMGFAVPGHTVEVIDEETLTFSGLGEEGSIAAKAPDPVMLLEYLNNPAATAKKFVEIDGTKWLITGDKGQKTKSGRIRFVGRDDDVISSSGYRIGPAEIEDCLLTHPAVKMAGVVGKPDEVRGSIVAAFIELADGYEAHDALADEIATHVKNRLAAYEYPRVIRFINDMPMTTSGKIIRAELRDRIEKETANA